METHTEIITDTYSAPMKNKLQPHAHTHTHTNS